jgi:predicted 2-oxoglutarate/Fe(II)-dependent dioxygenase YbiX
MKEGDLPDHERETQLVVEIPAVLNGKECDELLGYVAELGQVEGEVGRMDGRGSELDRTTRRVRQTSLPRTAETAWVYERLATVIEKCNQESFGFEVEGLNGDLVIVDYRAGDFYNWHLDLGPGEMARKLSVSVMLSPPDDYEGGGLTFPGAKFEKTPQGAAVVFASFLLHGVQPVKQGRRCALLAWFEGPPFR